MKLATLLLLALAPSAVAQISVTERFDINGGSFSSPEYPGLIAQRLYTGTWTFEYSVSGRVFQGDPTVGHSLRIVGDAGSGSYDPTGTRLAVGGPIGFLFVDETFDPVRVMQPVERTVTRQGSVVARDMPNTGFDSQSRELWSSLVAFRDFPTFVDGIGGEMNGGTGQPRFESANFTGFLDLVINLFPIAGQTSVCGGPATIEAYGDGSYLHIASQNLAPSAPAVLLTGSPATPMSTGLCIGGVSRVPNSLQMTSATGEYVQRVDTSGYLPGDSPVFQVWYIGASGRTFSSAVQLTL